MVYIVYRLVLGGIFIEKKMLRVKVNDSLYEALTEYSIISGDTISHNVRKAIILFLKYKGVLKKWDY